VKSVKGRDPNSIGQRIIDIRSMLNMTQEDISKDIYVSRSAVGQYETGVKLPSRAVIAHICNTYNVNKDWLLTGKGEIFITTAEVTKLEIIVPAQTQATIEIPTPTETTAPTETIIPTVNNKTFGRGHYQHARICGKAENVEQLDQSIRSTYMNLTNCLLEESDTEYGKVFTVVQKKYLNEMIVSLEQDQRNLMLYIEEALEKLAAVTQLKESIIEQRKMIGKLSTGNASTDHPFVVPDKLLGKVHPYLQELAGKAFDTPVAK
jgi:transcriptional regulator with XRE-family HTH domain